MDITNESTVIAHGDAGIANAGALMWWNLQAVDGDALAAAWTAEGLDPSMLPSGRRDHVVLREVCRAIARRIARVNVDADGDEISHSVRDLAEGAGCVIVRDKASRDDVEKDSTRVRVRFAAKLPGAVEGTDGLTIDGPDGSDWCELISTDFGRARGQVQTTPLSTLLSVRVSAMLDAVGLRSGGGLNYVPKHALPTLERVKRALDAVGCRVSTLPASNSGDIVRDVLASLQAESDSMIARMESELIEDELGPRACQGRARECDGQLSKLEKYEALLGANLQAIRDRIESLSSDYTAAALEALADI
jgi:hypothetical protein